MNLTPLALFAVTFVALLAGYPVALTLAGVALIFALVGTLTGAFDPTSLGFAAGRLFGIITNQTLIAVPLFIFMGVLLERTRIAKTCWQTYLICWDGTGAAWRLPSSSLAC